jgi:hypothetical protein
MSELKTKLMQTITAESAYSSRRNWRSSSGKRTERIATVEFQKPANRFVILVYPDGSGRKLQINLPISAVSEILHAWVSNAEL